LELKISFLKIDLKTNLVCDGDVFAVEHQKLCFLIDSELNADLTFKNLLVSPNPFVNNLLQCAYTFHEVSGEIGMYGDVVA